MHDLITHILYTRIPKDDCVEVVPICSSYKNISDGKYFQGYNGARTLSLDDLVDHDVTKFYRLHQPVFINEDYRLWLNSQGEIFYGMSLDLAKQIAVIK